MNDYQRAGIDDETALRLEKLLLKISDVMHIPLSSARICFLCALESAWDASKEVYRG